MNAFIESNYNVVSVLWNEYFNAMGLDYEPLENPKTPKNLEQFTSSQFLDMPVGFDHNRYCSMVSLFHQWLQLVSSASLLSKTETTLLDKQYEGINGQFCLDDPIIARGMAELGIEYNKDIPRGSTVEMNVTAYIIGRIVTYYKKHPNDLSILSRALLWRDYLNEVDDIDIHTDAIEEHMTAVEYLLTRLGFPVSGFTD